MHSPQAKAIAKKPNTLITYTATITLHGDRAGGLIQAGAAGSGGGRASFDFKRTYRPVITEQRCSIERGFHIPRSQAQSRHIGLRPDSVTPLQTRPLRPTRRVSFPAAAEHSQPMLRKVKKRRACVRANSTLRTGLHDIHALVLSRVHRPQASASPHMHTHMSCYAVLDNGGHPPAPLSPHALRRQNDVRSRDPRPASVGNGNALTV